ncbi:MAG: hypothetical protein E6K85_01120 [Thaumarchaeota archaeon]|nr:MAG: hypothetical protein E6K85_01120 [Nitrososphaerota archaeon]
MIILAGVVAAALLLYITLSLYVFPQMYQSIEPRRPEAVITNVSLSTPVIRLGQTFVISVTGTNRGEEADMQIVSVGFPNLTRADNMVVLEHNFTQTPIFINTSGVIGSEYSGTQRPVHARYPSVEAFSRPWPGGNTYNIDLQVRPEAEGRFVVLVKSVAFPHSWDGAHWPKDGVIDYQKELVEPYYVQVTKP